MGRQVSGQIRAALGRNQQPTGDVWETATTEPPDEAPECAWCPLCRAARLLRETKPGRDTRVTAVSDALGTVVQDAFNVLDAALATTGRAASGDGRRSGSAGPARSGSAKTGPAQTGPAKNSPAKAGPAQAGPAQTGPAKSSPAKAGPAQAGPAQAGPAQTGPAKTGPAQAGPAQAGPAQAGPADRPSTTAPRPGPGS